MALENTPLINNENESQFEINVDGQIAFISYINKDKVYYLVHTEVPEDLQGHGVAASLVEKTFKFLEHNGYKMEPFCPYVQSYLKRYPEWERLVAGS